MQSKKLEGENVMEVNRGCGNSQIRNSESVVALFG